jgi:hypothetical protein
MTYEEWVKTVPRCIGGEAGCDGDLVAEEHDAKCPMYYVSDSAGKVWAANYRDAFQAGRVSRNDEIIEFLDVSEDIPYDKGVGEALGVVLDFCDSMK